MKIFHKRKFITPCEIGSIVYDKNIRRNEDSRPSECIVKRYFEKNNELYMEYSTRNNVITAICPVKYFGKKVYKNIDDVL